MQINATSMKTVLTAHRETKFVSAGWFWSSMQTGTAAKPWDQSVWLGNTDALLGKLYKILLTHRTQDEIVDIYFTSKIFKCVFSKQDIEFQQNIILVLEYSCELFYQDILRPGSCFAPISYLDYLLTHWDWDKMTAILQSEFSNLFSCVFK